jgi:hypothetical protein
MVKVMLTKPFAETLEPRGEGGLVGGGIAVTILARAVGHASTLQFKRLRKIPPSKPRGPY